MSVAKVLANCPFCNEPIAGGALKCKHCQSDLAALAAAQKKKEKKFFARYNNFRFGFLTGVIFSVILTILLYLQFFRE